jgi:hypothetical protein
MVTSLPSWAIYIDWGHLFWPGWCFRKCLSHLLPAQIYRAIRITFWSIGVSKTLETSNSNASWSITRVRPGRSNKWPQSLEESHLEFSALCKKRIHTDLLVENYMHFFFKLLLYKIYFITLSFKEDLTIYTHTHTPKLNVF